MARGHSINTFVLQHAHTASREALCSSARAPLHVSCCAGGHRERTLAVPRFTFGTPARGLCSSEPAPAPATAPAPFGGFNLPPAQPPPPFALGFGTVLLLDRVQPQRQRGRCCSQVLARGRGPCVPECFPCPLRCLSARSEANRCSPCHSFSACHAPALSVLRVRPERVE